MNLLGLVNHVASVDADYLGDCSGRPSTESLRGSPTRPNPTPTCGRPPRSRPRTSSGSTAGSGSTPTHRDGPRAGRRRPGPLVAARAPRGHAAPDPGSCDCRDPPPHGPPDIVRELIDGTAGLRPDRDNLPPVDAAWWESYRDRLKRVVQRSGRRAGRPALASRGSTTATRPRGQSLPNRW